MPFTFAHPGYAVFLQRKYLPFMSVNGLVFGSIAPDLDILFRLTNARFHLFTYQIQEVVLLIFPVAFLMSLAFHRFSRNEIIRHLPGSMADRLKGFLDLDYRAVVRSNAPTVILSFFVGIYLHLFLDLLFHWNAHHVMMALHAGIYPVKWLLPYSFYSAWYLPLLVSTLIGFWLIWRYTGLRGMKWRSLIGEMTPGRWLFWSVFLVVALAVVALKSLLFGMEDSMALHYLSIHFTSGLLCSFLITPVLFTVAKRLMANG